MGFGSVRPIYAVHGLFMQCINGVFGLCGAWTFDAVHIHSHETFCTILHNFMQCIV